MRKRALERNGNCPTTPPPSYEASKDDPLVQSSTPAVRLGTSGNSKVVHPSRARHVRISFYALFVHQRAVWAPKVSIRGVFWAALQGGNIFARMGAFPAFSMTLFVR